MRLKSAGRGRCRAVVVLAAAVLATAVSCERRSSRTYQGPVRHVILISLDTTRKDHLGCYGNEWIRTPRIDALAAESILFTDYMTVTPTTLPSHTSLFTGRYPQSHGAIRNGFMVNQQNVMLAEVLKEAGFRTLGFIASFALDERFDFAQGFDHYDQTLDELISNLDEFEFQDHRSARSVTDAVVRYLDREGVPANMFLFVHYFDPHTPYAPPAPYDTLYEHPGVRSKTPPDLHEVRRRLTRSRGRVSSNARTLACLYAGEVSYMDEHVGRLLDDLKDRGVLDEAILIITSDHGETFWEHPHDLDPDEYIWERPYYFNHGNAVYQTTIGAVCMIRLPGGAQKGAVCDFPVANIDILPTLLNYLGLPVPRDVEGMPLSLANPAVRQPQRVYFGEASSSLKKAGDRSPGRSKLKDRFAREGRFKYIEKPFLQTVELYDLSVDPEEQNDLLSSPMPKAKAKAGELRGFLREWLRSAAPLPSHFESSQEEDTIRRLKSLGYLGE
jgi:arylsulfatase A-like enzyme